MPYSEFTIDTVVSRFSLELTEDSHTFSRWPALQPSETLSVLLAETLPLATAISTEKARSELIIMPVLLEARRRAGTAISLFSGVDFSVDASQGLNGVCDFLLSRSKQQLLIEAPAVAVVEAKNENLKSGFAQCMAEMIAARIFNERARVDISPVYGVVTTGSLWSFLSLEKNEMKFAPAELHISNLSHILGVLVGMLSPQEREL